jgi:hypothetical protein
MTVSVAGVYAQVQRLVSVVKMATVLEVYTNGQQRSVVRSMWPKELNAKDTFFIYFNFCCLQWEVSVA